MKSEIKKVIKEIVKILSSHDEISWARYFQDCEMQLDDDYQAGIYNIRKVYGGMGSFNDLVLHKNGVPLKKENDRLDQLRHELYDLSR
ncbi:DUF6966 domain-containing protein [Erwinia pyrifoliae]|uniref:DUF6966 domain-containing protein n=1 Tax=Erwinia pyrifoliae TaxID=79967 RepID=UPI00223BBCAD|nr:hypothetical protein [Erwinia pyrifoliae]MCT2387996.1 hypothetical protein [Erwinia pyrifoliae]MCU8586166.1 hypothetical protein [Erwinia pyrifoliae]